MKKNHKSRIISLSWRTIEHYTKTVLSQLKKRTPMINCIVTMSRGGLVPAVMLSHQLGIRSIIIIDANRTENDDVHAEKHEVRFSYHPNAVRAVREKHVLLLDDIAGSGDTLHTAQKIVHRFHPASITTATLVVNLDNLKDRSLKPSVVGKEVRGWIVFPWEQANIHKR